jgi:hypothetical protein
LPSLFLVGPHGRHNGRANTQTRHRAPMDPRPHAHGWHPSMQNWGIPLRAPPLSTCASCLGPGTQAGPGAGGVRERWTLPLSRPKAASKGGKTQGDDGGGCACVRARRANPRGQPAAHKAQGPPMGSPFHQPTSAPVGEPLSTPSSTGPAPGGVCNPHHPPKKPHQHAIIDPCPQEHTGPAGRAARGSPGRCRHATEMHVACGAGVGGGGRRPRPHGRAPGPRQAFALPHLAWPCWIFCCDLRTAPVREKHSDTPMVGHGGGGALAGPPRVASRPVWGLPVGAVCTLL